jgi:hypothetical protein
MYYTHLYFDLIYRGGLDHCHHVFPEFPIPGSYAIVVKVQLRDLHIHLPTSPPLLMISGGSEARGCDSRVLRAGARGLRRIRAR